MLAEKLKDTLALTLVRLLLVVLFGGFTASLAVGVIAKPMVALACFAGLSVTTALYWAVDRCFHHWLNPLKRNR